jgi:hypothetical protein
VRAGGTSPRSLEGAANLFAIEDEFLNLLVEETKAIEPDGVPKDFTRGLRLLNNANKRITAGYRDGASLGARADVLERELELRDELLGSLGSCLHDMDRVIADYVAISTPALERDSLDRVPSEIDPKNGVRKFFAHSNNGISRSGAGSVIF